MKFLLVAIISILFLSSCGKENVSLPYEEQLAKDQAAIDKYLLDSSIIANTDPEGLGFKFNVTAGGSEFKPALIDSVGIKYSVTILNGRQVFKDSITTFLLSNLIKPWKTILPVYGEGSSLTLFVPSGLAYGTYPTGTYPKAGDKTNNYIPANSNLIFDIELKKVVRDYATQFKKDTTEIGSSLKTKSETTLVDPSGIRYKITNAGKATGLVPLATDSVVVRYKGQLFFDGSEFENQLSNPTGLGFLLSKSSTPKSWQKILPLIKEDAKVTLYVPSGLGYGPYGNSAKNVPAYANLTYEIELVKVIRK
jgi:FKBP-type peptidyl-prolyl cis-trans isomerase